MSVYHKDQLDKISGKIKDIKFGMFTSTDDSKIMTSRPMTCQQIDGEGNMWFFVSDEASFGHDLLTNPGVNVSFASPGDSLYLSVFGRAEMLRDHRKAEELWNPLLKAWFPGGLADPHLALIRLRIQSAEYWDASSSKMMQLFSMARAALTGERPTGLGEHATICL
ncbi:pyridoxamine 5'-phosphate oxidase family protein [Oxalobacteraceae bacterium]|nr:pyridoxamine 5'-phosphate oxidase family protein [Oxalobacteraceae bacterium]